jgi:DNA topoisomerase I
MDISRRLAKALAEKAPPPDLPPAEAARAARLHYVADSAPGITRRRSGTGFTYRDAQGRAIRDPQTLARIKALAVPPAWTEVWICADPRGHLQATGRDDRGRKQWPNNSATRRRSAANATSTLGHRELRHREARAVRDDASRR